MSDLDIDAIKARVAAADAGPWLAIADTVKSIACEHNVYCDAYHAVHLRVHGYGRCHANAEFIAHAIDDVPALVARVQELERSVLIVKRAARLLETSRAARTAFEEKIVRSAATDGTVGLIKRLDAATTEMQQWNAAATAATERLERLEDDHDILRHCYEKVVAERDDLANKLLAKINAQSLDNVYVDR